MCWFAYSSPSSSPPSSVDAFALTERLAFLLCTSGLCRRIRCAWYCMLQVGLHVSSLEFCRPPGERKRCRPGRDVLEQADVREHRHLRRCWEAEVARQCSVMRAQLHVCLADNLLNLPNGQLAVRCISVRCVSHRKPGSRQGGGLVHDVHRLTCYFHGFRDMAGRRRDV